MATVLVSGFEPFGGEQVNPSELILKDLPAQVASRCERKIDLHCLILPVGRFEADGLLLKAIADIEPELVIMFGEAGGRAEISLERVAINIDDYKQPCNLGTQPRDEPICANGESAYFTRLPIRRITERLNQANIPAAISNSAGTYLCNRVFYCVMHHLAETASPVRAGFVHLPYCHEQVAAHAVSQPSFSRSSLCEAAATVVSESLSGE